MNPAARSVFDFRGPGVAHSTPAGLPWLYGLRRDLKGKSVHFWPFDGFCVPDGASVLAEVYPALFWRRHGGARENEHERDAWSVAKWLREMDRSDRLGRYFKPPLTRDEQTQAQLEGWILGVG